MTEPRKRNLGDRLFAVFLGLVFIVMAGELILLTLQNRELKANLTALSEQMNAMRSAMTGLKVGEVLEPLELPTLAGPTWRLGYDDPVRDTVLLFFSPDCPACRDNFDNWKQLVRTHDPTQRYVVYVSTEKPEKTAEYARDNSLPDPVLLSDEESLARYKVDQIPTTIVVGPGGVVKHVWVGKLTSEALATLGVAGS